MIVKIAIITLNQNDNYGNRLQNYALQEYLLNEIKINKIETIWYDPQYMYISKVEAFNWKTWIKYFINWKNQRTYLKKNI